MWKRADDEVRSLVARLICEGSGAGNTAPSRSEKTKKADAEAPAKLVLESQIDQSVRKELIYETDTDMPVLRLMPHRPKNTD